jgi:hypothetical protein
VTLNPERETAVQVQLSRSTDGPAFPPRPANATAAARSAGDGRNAAARSCAQPPPGGEHGEAGEHRTDHDRPRSADSTVDAQCGIDAPADRN